MHTFSSSRISMLPTLNNIAFLVAFLAIAKSNASAVSGIKQKSAELISFSSAFLYAFQFVMKVRGGSVKSPKGRFPRVLKAPSCRMKFGNGAAAPADKAKSSLGGSFHSSFSYTIISSTLQFRILHKSPTLCVVIPSPFLIRSMVALLMPYLLIRVYVLSPFSFKVFQKGVYLIILITNLMIL